MKKTGYTCLVLFVLLTMGRFSQAQNPTFIAPSTSVDYGALYKAHIKAKGFENLTGLQFIISWDSTVLQYKGIQDFGLKLSLEQNFGITEASRGTLRFLWFDEALSPVTLKDSAVLFGINFEVIGAPQTQTELAFSGDFLTQIEVYDRNFDKVDAKFEHGQLSVSSQGTSGSYYVSDPEEISMKAASPNPFSASTRIDFRIGQTTTAIWRIIDAQGRLIFEEERRFDSGDHSIALDGALFPASGIYYYQMRSSDFTVTQKLIVL